MKWGVPIIDGKPLPHNQPGRCCHCSLSVPELQAVYHNRTAPYQNRYDWELHPEFYIEPRHDGKDNRLPPYAWAHRKANMLGCTSATWAEHKAKKQKIKCSPPAHVLEIIWVRHGQTWHNKLKSLFPELTVYSLAYILFAKPDSTLNQLGYIQAHDAFDILRTKDQNGDLPPIPELWLTSRHERTLQTATVMADIRGEGSTVPILASEHIREKTHSHPCDSVSPKSRLIKTYPQIEFPADVPETDTLFMCWTCRNRLGTSLGHFMDPQQESAIRAILADFDGWTEEVAQFGRLAPIPWWFETVEEKMRRGERALDHLFDVVRKGEYETLGVVGHRRMTEIMRMIVHRSLAVPCDMVNGEIRGDVVMFWQKGEDVEVEPATVRQR